MTEWVREWYIVAHRHSLDISFSLTGLLAFIGKLFKSLWQLLRPGHTQPPGLVGPIPQTTIIITLAGPPHQARWQVGQQQTGPKGQVSVMILDAHFTVTNMSTYNVRLQTAVLKVGKVWPKKFDAQVLVQPPGSQVFETQMIPSGGITQIMVMWHIEPPVWKPGKDRTADVGVIDNFNNCHWVKRVTFKYI